MPINFAVGAPGAARPPADAPALHVHADRPSSPGDTPQSVKFCPNNSTLFSCVSWDQKLRLYAVGGPQTLTRSAEVALGQFPLSQAWNAAANGCFVALSDGSLAHVDLAAQMSTKHAANAAPILQIAYYARGNYLLGIDADKGLLVYGNGAAGKSAPDFALKLPEQPLSFAVDGQTLLLCLARNKILFLDLQALSQYTPAELSPIESQLGSPLSAALLDEQAKEYCIASADGRVYKGLFTSQGGWNGRAAFGAPHNASDTVRNFTFVAQGKKRADNRSDLYSINCMGGNPRSRQFLYTAGSDGVLTFWDVKERNKITAYTAPAPISCGDVSADGQMLALGLGYDWSQGVWGLPEVNYLPAVAIKRIAESELSFKSKP